MSSTRESLLSLLSDVYGNNISEHLKMPIISHINVGLVVAEELRPSLHDEDYQKLIDLTLFHDLVMIYPDYVLPEQVNQALAISGITLAELKAVSLKRIRDELGHNYWAIIAPLYVKTLLAFQSEICIISALICWNSHVIFCVRNHNQPYLDDLAIMCREFETQMNTSNNVYNYGDLIRKLVRDYDLALRVAYKAIENSTRLG